MGSNVSAKASSSGDSTTTASSKQQKYVRRAHHAGSWYDDDGVKLRATLEGYLREAELEAEQAAADGVVNGDDSCPPPLPPRSLRGLIVPHAGFSYSGPTAAHAYLALRRALLGSTAVGGRGGSSIRRILVLHPSHHVHLEGCAVSNATVLETPVGPLEVDADLRREILGLSSSKFSLMDRTTDEEEHSGEMQYPFLAHVLGGLGGSGGDQSSDDPTTTIIKVLPVMCGALSTASEKVFGEILADIVARPDVLTVVSTDFCHWGPRFSYRPTSDGATTTNTVPIHEFIERLDRRGMEHIELQQPGAFAAYLKETKNTICGRHAVAVWLRAITASSSTTVDKKATSNGTGSNNNSDDQLQVEFVKYAQSSQVKAMGDSSVSYAAAVATTSAATLPN